MSIRRSLSGIMFMHKFDDDEKNQPTAFEDLPKERQKKIIAQLKPEAINNLALQLAESLKSIGDQLNLLRETTDT